MTGLGMAAIDALKSATSNDAELLGIAQKVGTLEKGKLADIIFERACSFSVDLQRRAFFSLSARNVLAKTFHCGVCASVILSSVWR